MGLHRLIPAGVGIGEMIGGICAYHQTKNIIGALFESGIEADFETGLAICFIIANPLFF